MKKKLLTLGVISLVFGWNAHAAIRDGFYVGAGAGATFDDYTIIATNQATNVSPRVSTNKTSVLGDVFLGYGYTSLNQFYLAAELGTYFPNRSATFPPRPGATVTSVNFIDEGRAQDYLTGDLLLGYRYALNWLAYVRLGLLYSHVGLYQPAQSGINSFRADKNGLGERAGVGLNYTLNECLGIGVDYYYTSHPKLRAYWATYNIQFVEKLNSNFVGLSVFYTI